MIANYHTHTFRCHHASGTEREYIEKAIAEGLTVMGFSDHVPMPFPDGHQSGFRVRIEELEDYIRTLEALREEYKDRIQILIGFEAEYYPAYFEAMLELVLVLIACDGEITWQENKFAQWLCGMIRSR